MELSLIGLQAAGKTSLVNVIATGSFQENMIPTVGFNMRKVTKGSVTIKLWDLGGQVLFHILYLMRSKVAFDPHKTHDDQLKAHQEGKLSSDILHRRFC